MQAEEIIDLIVNTARTAGATQSEVLLREGIEFSTQVRLGTVEKLLQASFRKLGIRIFSGTRSASSATSDFSETALKQITLSTLEMAREGNDDPCSGLPDPPLYLRQKPQLDLDFPAIAEMSAERKIELARKCEQAAMKFDARITNSEGAGYSDQRVKVSYGNSLGIRADYSKTISTLHCTPLAEVQGRKQRDYWLSTNLDVARLESPEQVGRQAARRTLRRLGARKVATGEVPVVFDPITAAALLKHVGDAVSGTALLRKASFLLGKLGQRVASANVTVVDDAALPGGVGARPFDSEGVPSQTTTVIRNGVLENYLLDCYSARKLGLHSTANSTREPHQGPNAGPSNLHVTAGNATPDQIISSISNGLYVTELIGFGVNLVSGNFSQGAAGMWIENGVPAYAVEEITIAGNLKEMLTSIEAVGNDPVIFGEVFAPTLMISKMVVSGS